MAKKKKKAEGGGVPAWMATFADLMTLLLTFFVLLVAFSNTDVKKYKKLAGSMAQAFGTNSSFSISMMPSGNHIVMDKAGTGESKGQPNSKEYDPAHMKNSEEKAFQQGELGVGTQAIHDDVNEIREMISSEVDSGIIQVDAMDDRIVLRIDDEGAFKSGRAKLHPSFKRTLDKLAPMLRTMPGSITVGGHTDDRPIKSRRFRSNWDLSSARAASVVHYLTGEGGIDSARAMAQGFADSRPLVPNDTDEGRRQNRRVEISIVRPVEDLKLP